MPSEVMRCFIIPSKTKFELVSPGCTLADIQIPYLFLISMPLCLLAVIVMRGTGKPERVFAIIDLSYINSFVTIYLVILSLDSLTFKSEASDFVYFCDYIKAYSLLII